MDVCWSLQVSNHKWHHTSSSHQRNEAEEIIDRIWGLVDIGGTKLQKQPFCLQTALAPSS